MAKKELTDKQRELYDFIRNQIEELGWPPTNREMMDHMKLRSPNGVIAHVRALAKKGYIKVVPKQSRCIRLAGHRLKHVKVRD